MSAKTLTVGEALIALLEQAGVDTVFGIPGVHTIELYRGLAGSKIRHVTPRHEQGAAFMADGYARISGKPGVCLLITGPGLTNALTAMAQARADSIPMLVITGVNARATLGKGLGHLHELPDQSAMVKTIALWSHTLLNPDELGTVIAQAFYHMLKGRPGPVHIEIPTDVMKMRVALPGFASLVQTPPAQISSAPGATDLSHAATLLNAAKAPVILCGGGSVRAGGLIGRLAGRLDAPVVQTVNARGIIGSHPLSVPASPSLNAVRSLLANADVVLALGTEFGPTDYDMYETGTYPQFQTLIRVDCDAAQLARRDFISLGITADIGACVEALLPGLKQCEHSGASTAKTARAAAYAELSPAYQNHVQFCRRLYDMFPDAVLVGDSTQLVYAGNLYLDVPQPSSWFNSATGFGALGYGPSAAIGAALAAPHRKVLCLVGDGGFQFSLAELGTAVDENVNLIFIVWNNKGYLEIESAMVSAGVEPIGVKPSAPDFAAIAQAYGMKAIKMKTTKDGTRFDGAALEKYTARPLLVEISDF
jgi:acetolactate synthase-1/2/3 large subunit